MSNLDKPIGLIAGLKSETDCLPGYRGDLAPVVRCAGANSRRAAEMARLLVAKGVSGLLSFGLAGALAPELKTGHLVVADKVIGDDGLSLATDNGWSSAFLSEVAGRLPISVGGIAGSETVVASAQAKASLYEKTGCLVTDMESLAVAGVAAKAGLPFLAVRIVADRASQSIPAWVTTEIDDQGRPKTLNIIAKSAVHPFDWPTLISLGFAEKKALKGLRTIIKSVGPTFAL